MKPKRRWSARTASKRLVPVSIKRIPNTLNGNRPDALSKQDVTPIVIFQSRLKALQKVLLNRIADKDHAKV